MKFRVKNRASVLALLFLLAAGSGRAAPGVTLIFPDLDPDMSIAAGSFVTVSSAETIRFELRIEDAFSDVQAATVRVTMNGAALGIFSRVNRLPKGARVFVDLSKSLNSDYRLRPYMANTLVLEARDEAGNRYSGTFEISCRPTSAADQRVLVNRTSDAAVFVPEERFSAPRIRYQKDLPNETIGGHFTVIAEIEDEYGLREVMVEVNSKVIDTVLVENGLPVRKRGAFATLEDLPGRIEGNASSLTMEVPVPLKKSINVVAVTAVNAKGIRNRETWTVRRVKAR